jgi:hypothetical protein
LHVSCQDTGGHQVVTFVVDAASGTLTESPFNAENALLTNSLSIHGSMCTSELADNLYVATTSPIALKVFKTSASSSFQLQSTTSVSISGIVDVVSSFNGANIYVVSPVSVVVFRVSDVAHGTLTQVAVTTEKSGSGDILSGVTSFTVTDGGENAYIGLSNGCIVVYDRNLASGDLSFQIQHCSVAFTSQPNNGFLAVPLIPPRHDSIHSSLYGLNAVSHLVPSPNGRLLVASDLTSVFTMTRWTFYKVDSTGAKCRWTSNTISKEETMQRDGGLDVCTYASATSLSAISGGVVTSTGQCSVSCHVSGIMAWSADY